MKEKLDIRAQYISCFMKEIEKIKDPDHKIKLLSSRVVELEFSNRNLRQQLKSCGFKPADLGICIEEKTAIGAAVDSKFFYKSKAWRQLRFEFLKKIVKKECSICNRNMSDGCKLHVDHIRPRSIYPELALEIKNLQLLCEDCNIGKGTQVHDVKKIILRKKQKQMKKLIDLFV